MQLYRYFQILSLFILMLGSSCITEQKLADQYLAQLPGSPFFIIPQYELFKDNFTVNYDTTVQYTPEQYDSIEWFQSYYLQYLSDSIYLTQFTNSLISELTLQGFNVFVNDSSVIFDSLTDPKKVIKIAELQLSEEHGIEFSYMDIVDNEKVSIYGFHGNRVCLDSWIEVISPDTSAKQVLHLAGCYTDNFVPGFDPDQLENVKDAKNFRDSLEITDLYRMADESGRKHAELLLDYFLTEYIRAQLPKYFAPTMEYYHYDRNSKSLVPALQERFDVINEEERPASIKVYPVYDDIIRMNDMNGILD